MSSVEIAPYHTFFLLTTVPYNYHFIKHFGVRFQHHIDYFLISKGNFLFFVTDVRKL